MAASRGEELNTRLTATDDASKVVDDVAEKVADLEDREHDIDLSADTDEVDSELSALDKRLRGLTDDEKRIVLQVAARDAQRDLDRINRDLARAEKYDDDEIAIRIEAKGDAERKLNAIQSEIRDIDGASPSVRPEVDSSELDAFVDKLDGLAGGRLGGLTAATGAAGGLAAVLGTAATQTVQIGTEVQTIATVLGTTTEQASRLRAVFADSNIEANDLQDIALQTTDVLADAADIASKIGIGVEDAQQPAEALKAAINGWDFLTATERSRLFGEEGVRQIGQIIARGEDLDDLLAGVEERRVFSDEDVENARQTLEIVTEFAAKVEALTVTIGGPLVDAINDFDDAVARIPGSDGLADLIGQGLEAALYGPAGNIWEQYGRDSGEDAGNAFIDGITDTIRTRIDSALSGLKLGARDTEDAIAGVGGALSDIRDAADQDAPTGLFGGIRDQAEDTGEAIEEDVLGPLDLLRKRLDEEDTFARLAEQFNKVKANPEDREETRRLLRMVLDLGDAYEDLPPAVVTKLFTEIDQGSLDAAQATLLSLSSGRAVNFTVNPGVAFQIDQTGRNAPQQIDTTPQIGTTVVNNYYPVAPTSSAVDQLSNAHRFANGSREQPV